MKRVLLWILGIVLILLIAAWFDVRWWLTSSVADYQGDVTVSGISHPVEITFDAKGIPQVWAATDGDLYFALGWLHASERLFQMELVRHFVQGTLSEVFGQLAFMVDVQQRRLGFARKAAGDINNLPREAKTALEQYCRGINAWIRQHGTLPPEFFLLRATPKPWTVEDCLGIAFYQTWFSHSLMARDQMFHRLIGQLGEDIDTALKQYKEWSPTTVHDPFIKSFLNGNPFPYRMANASNSWVVSPGKSVSGKALHASDPHLAVNQVPGFWYIAGLHSRQGTNVLGVTAPGLPLVVMGHNDAIAYAFTVSSVDVTDYYRYRRAPEDSLKILTPRGYQPLRIIDETIHIQGKKQPVHIPVYITPLGPVIQSDSASVLAVRWAGYDFSPAEMVASALKLHRATNYEQFRRAVTRFGALDANWTYSDINGNIGYQLGTPIPRRSYRETFRELPGEDSTNVWHGYYPLEQTPHILNPPEGWLATCNNQIVSPKWQYEIPGFYDPYRITRITRLLEAKTKYSGKDFEAMQLDRISGFALRWKNLMAEGARKIQRPELADNIEHWDGNMNEDSEMAALFNYWWQFLASAVFEDELGEEWESGEYILEEVLSQPVEGVIDNQYTKGIKETLADVSGNALQNVLKNYEGRKYGEVSHLIIHHPLSKIKLLDSWLHLSRGPFPMGGDRGTLNVNQHHFNRQSGEFACVVAPSMRFVLDWADVDGFTINGNLGQSGNPFSPHYDDFLEMMLSGGRWNVPFSKNRVYEKKHSLLVLKPGNE